MEQATLTSTRCFVRDFVDGQEVDEVFVVRGRTVRQKRNGDPFLKLQLGDLTGSVEAVMWDNVKEAEPVCGAGTVIRVSGRYGVDARYGAGITVRALRAAAEGEYDLVDLAEGPPVPYAQMAADLEALVDTVQHPHLRELLQRLLDRSTEAGRRWHEAPAAKYYHQAYRHGLLEHCLSVAQGVSALAATFPAIDRDVAVTGALLHDIGKLEAYAWTGQAIELTDAGKLLGEIPLGYFRVRTEMDANRRLPAGHLPGRAPHHPQPPRQARARQPGGPVHPRGHPGALHRQPRRQPGQLRPDREEPRGGRPLVGLRPRHLGLGVFRAQRGREPPRSR